MAKKGAASGNRFNTGKQAATFDLPALDFGSGGVVVAVPSLTGFESLKESKTDRADAIDELTETTNKVRTAFGEAIQRQREAKQAATDSEFWCALYFETRAAKEEFLRKAGLTSLGDKYIRGEDAAAALGIELGTAAPKFNKPKRHKRVDDLAK